jgi:GH25 family lysozyme M1 (1,4-beta-N-acetylmuramidase)
MKLKQIILSTTVAAILVMQSAGAAYASSEDAADTSSSSYAVSDSAADPTVSDSTVTGAENSNDSSGYTEDEENTADSSGYTEGEEEMTYMGITMQDEDSSDSDFNLHGAVSSTASLRFSNYNTRKGIDVSHWQGTIDWTSVANSGVQFAVIKATGRGCYTSSSGSLYTDAMFATNIKGAINAGIPVGVYCFSAAITEQEAIDEANYTCDKLQGYNISLPVFIDYEYTTGYRMNNGASVATRTKIIDAFCRTVAARGYTPGIYASDSLLKTNVDGVTLAKSYTMWVASYSSAIHYYTGIYDMWQYSCTGSVDGISRGSSTDLDYWYEPVSSSGNAVPMYRLYNSLSGEHFYTASTTEWAYLREIGWVNEGIGWYAPTGGTAVYRLYNPNAGDHHYTTSASERDYLVSVGWNYEGIGWYSEGSDGAPLYRDYNPNAAAGAHNYTTSVSEHNNLMNVGWQAEGIGWYAVK